MICYLSKLTELSNILAVCCQQTVFELLIIHLRNLKNPASLLFSFILLNSSEENIFRVEKVHFIWSDNFKNSFLMPNLFAKFSHIHFYYEYIWKTSSFAWKFVSEISDCCVGCCSVTNRKLSAKLHFKKCKFWFLPKFLNEVLHLLETKLIEAKVFGTLCVI